MEVHVNVKGFVYQRCLRALGGEDTYASSWISNTYTEAGIARDLLSHNPRLP